MNSIYQTIQVVPVDEIEHLITKRLTHNEFPEVMTWVQVCRYTQFSRPTIQKAIDEKGFPVSERCGHFRFVKSEVDRWLKGEI